MVDISNYVKWGHLNERARDALKKAARQSFKEELDDRACCRGLGHTVKFLRGVNEQLAQPSE